MAKKILIVGGGLSGTIVANGLCRQLREELSSGSVTITMIGATDKHMYQPGLLYIPFGKMRESELFRDQRKVLDRRVPYIIDPAKHIDTDKKSVTTELGKTHTYDLPGDRHRLAHPSGQHPGHDRGRQLVLRPRRRAQNARRAQRLQGRQDRGQRQRAAQMPGGAARDHLHAARLPRRQGPARQERDYLHLSDRPAARARAGRALDGAGIREGQHQSRRPSSIPSRSTPRPRPSPRKKAPPCPTIC